MDLTQGPEERPRRVSWLPVADQASLFLQEREAEVVGISLEMLAEMQTNAREEGYQAGRETAARDAAEALRLARLALTHDAQLCRYHGARFDFLGMQFGEPRCESCRQPWRVTRALAAVKRAIDLGRSAGCEGQGTSTGTEVAS